MATPEEVQRNILAVLSTALKATPVAAKVDPNQVLMALSVDWSVSLRDDQFDLQPVYDFLTAKGAVPNEATVVCLLVSRREERLGVKVRLPREVEKMSKAERDQIVAALPKMGATGLTVVPSGTAPASPTVRVATSVSKPPGTPSRSDNAVKEPPKKFKKLNTGQRGPVSAGTIILSVVLLLVGIGIKVALRDPMPEPVKKPLPPALASLKAFTFEEYLYFYDPQKDFDLTKEQLEALGAEIAKVVAEYKVERAYMCLAEDPLRCRKPKAAVRGTKVIFMNKIPTGASRGAPPPAKPATP